MSHWPPFGGDGQDIPDPSDVEARTIRLELSALEAAAVICGLGLVSTMLGADDAGPPDTVLRMMDEIGQVDALAVCLKIQLAVEQQIVGL